MEIFFNDALLLEQFADYEKTLFIESIKQISSFNDTIVATRNEFRDSSFNYWVNKDVLKTFFELIELKELGNLLLYSLSKAKIKDLNERYSKNSGANYFFVDNFNLPPKNLIIDDTSLSEVAERKLLYKGNSHLIINIPDLLFSQRAVLLVMKIDYTKNNETEFIKIEAADNARLINEWIIKELDSTTLYRYDIDSNEPPTDLQTCLRSKIRFDETSTPNQGGRKVYRDNKTGNLWYVDSRHIGASAHLEVFDSTGKKHLGEADIDGHINVDKAKKNRNIEI